MSLRAIPPEVVTGLIVDRSIPPRFPAADVVDYQRGDVPVLRIGKHEIIGGREPPDIGRELPVKEILLRAFCPRIIPEELPVAQEKVVP